MFTWLAALPVLAQVLLVLVVLSVAVILAFIGKVNLKLGKYNFSFGKSFKKTVTKYRSCEDCRKLVMIRTMKFDHEVKVYKDDILRDQMNYTEQKIHEISYMLTSSYRDDMISLRKEGQPVDQTRENKEYLLYQEALSCAMVQIKNELRRAFKENGFMDFSNNEFSDYVRGKTKLLISVGREYLRSRYPFENMIVPLEWRFDRLPESQIESAVSDLFSKAKQIKLVADEKIEQLGIKYDKDMEEFTDILSSKK